MSSKKKLSSYESYEYFGEFFLAEDSYEVKFAGKVSFSPENGLVLTYSISDSRLPREAERLFAILDNGKKCTLIGPFDFSGGTMRFGSINTKFGRHGFQHLLVGDFIDKDTKLEKCHFTFGHMQDFFFNKGHELFVAFEDGNLHEIRSKEFQLNVKHVAFGHNVDGNLRNVIVPEIDSGDLARELHDSIEELTNKYPKQSVLLRKSLEYYFEYSANNAKSAENIYDDLYKISSLFSVFMFKPILLDVVEFIYKQNRIQLLSSQFVESRTLEVATSKSNHFHLPINNKKVSLEEVVPNWLQHYEEFRVISTTLMFETNFRTLHSAYSDIVLYITQLESINHSLGMSKDTRFENPIRHYGCTKLINNLEVLLAKASKDSVGKSLSTVRNEIAHLTQSKKMMNKLNLSDYVEIGHLLRLIAISHLLATVGVELQVIHEYQDRLL
ncbi:hypothetical protein KS665_004511 [Vibrio parahaemolyticus]|nr:hypothetical protein [Vibrio parahaemolyticus]MBE4498896.1 hypothetical protein [Vibrio parahaemolyticus]